MKLLDLLVKELPKRGGFPKGANECVQDADGTLKFFDSDGLFFGGKHGWCGSPRGGFYCTKEDKIIGLDLCCDHSSAIITLSKYESALAKNDGWIEWGGGECPVDGNTMIDIQYRDGTYTEGEEAMYSCWSYTNESDDIIAYRLHKPDINSRTNDDRLEQDLNECIGQGVKGFALGFGGDKNPLISPAWNGDGVPPVGIECEVKWAGGKWEKCEVLFVGIEKVVVDMRNREAAMSLCDVKFRPLRTEAQKAMESAKHIIADLCRDSASNGHSADLIMEAIAAGKVPGVKLESK